MLSSMRLARTLTRTERLELLTRSAKFSTATEQQRLVVAVGGNALQRRGERLTIENQLKAAMEAAPTLKKLAMSHELILTHGNGPQVGELALERSAATFDVLGAESQGQIGYILSQAMASVGLPAAAIVTQVRVDPLDQAFSNPTKFVGPVYGAKESEALATQLDWTGWRTAALKMIWMRVVKMVFERRVGSAWKLPLTCEWGAGRLAAGLQRPREGRRLMRKRRGRKRLQMGRGASGV